MQSVNLHTKAIFFQNMVISDSYSKHIKIIVISDSYNEHVKIIHFTNFKPYCTNLTCHQLALVQVTSSDQSLQDSWKCKVPIVQQQSIFQGYDMVQGRPLACLLLQYWTVEWYMNNNSHKNFTGINYVFTILVLIFTLPMWYLYEVNLQAYQMSCHGVPFLYIFHCTSSVWSCGKINIQKWW